MNELDKTEKALNGALCDFCNSASDPFPPVSQWDDEVRRNFAGLCSAYNDWYTWLKSTGRDPFAH